MFGWIKTYRDSGKERCETGVCYKNLRTVVPGKIYRSAAPDSHLTMAMLVHGLNLKTVLDLRLDENRTAYGYDPREHDWCDALGVHHSPVPMHDDKPILESEFNNALNTIAVLEGPILVHCEGGRHRTGAVIAAYRVLVEGWTRDRAWKEAEDCGYYDAMGHKPVRLSWEAYVTTKLLDRAGR